MRRRRRRCARREKPNAPDASRMRGMEFAVVTLAVAVLVLVVALRLALKRPGSASRSSDELGRAVERVPVEPATLTAPNSRNALEVVPVGPTYELRLSDHPLMQFDPISSADLPSRTNLSGTYTHCIGALLDN